ncbi:Pr6Pr family membrane protein [Actinoplanes sp. NPDC049802]|uniref:Pr6Pr family membrane protein n=1 Tax=Actinoplanes sp. NPDC049802 TaxID=3154742 RepID=UPI0033FE81CB
MKALASPQSVWRVLIIVVAVAGLYGDHHRIMEYTTQSALLVIGYHVAALYWMGHRSTTDAPAHRLRTAVLSWILLDAAMLQVLTGGYNPLPGLAHAEAPDYFGSAATVLIANWSFFLLRYVLPLMVLADWLAFRPYGGTRWRDLPLWLLYPLGWAGVAVGRSALLPLAEHSAPYRFLDLDRGLPAVASWILTLSLAYVAGSAMLIAVDHSRAPRPPVPEPPTAWQPSPEDAWHPRDADAAWRHTPDPDAGRRPTADSGAPWQPSTGSPDPGRPPVRDPRAPAQAAPGHRDHGSPARGPHRPEGPVPGQPVPGQSIPGSRVPGEPIPGQPVLGSRVPGEPIPGQPVLGSRVPGEPGRKPRSGGERTPGPQAPGEFVPGPRTRDDAGPASRGPRTPAADSGEPRESIVELLGRRRTPVEPTAERRSAPAGPGPAWAAPPAGAARPAEPAQPRPSGRTAPETRLPGGGGDSRGRWPSRRQDDDGPWPERRARDDSPWPDRPAGNESPWPDWPAASESGRTGEPAEEPTHRRPGTEPADERTDRRRGSGSAWRR